MELNLALACGETPLGEGTSGAVHALTRSIDGRNYCVKICKPSDTALAECRLQASLPPNDGIIRYDFAWVHDKSLHILMERVKGELWDAIETPEPQPDQEERLGWARALLTGLACIHSHGVCHRDISPWNCFLTEATDATPRRLKIGDFGLGCRVLSTSAGGSGLLFGMHSAGFAALDESAVGSYYSAPELGSDSGYDPMQVDVFSAGMTLFAMWHGIVTSTAAPPTAGEVVDGDLTDCVELLKQDGTLPASWAGAGPIGELVLRMTSRKATLRPAAAECVELLRQATEQAAPISEQIDSHGCFGAFHLFASGRHRRMKSKRIAPAPTMAVE